MRWKKLGRLWHTTPRYDWMQSHAANPVAEHLDGEHYRVYFSCRDRQNISSIAYIEFNLSNPQEILKVANTPVLSPGEIGTFDDNGASMGCLVKVGNQRYLYYLGWNLGVTVPWRNSIGLAVSKAPDAPFERVSMAPVLDRNDKDPYSISYPWVHQDSETGLWRMWYGSNLRWGKEQQDMDHLLKYAESKDGLHWEPTGIISVDFKSPDEYALSKPCVIFEDGLYKMWYSYRGTRYRIGYAESNDGIKWNRKDNEAGIDISSEGWDSEMICYPNVFMHEGRKYLLYNGNAYGRDGIGLAVED